MEEITDVERGLTSAPPWDIEPASSWEDTALGLRIVDRTALFKKIGLIMGMSSARVAAKVRADFNSDPKLPKKLLESSHWPSEDERLLYLRYWFEFHYGFDGGKVDPDAVFASMVDYEIRRQAPQLVVSNPPAPMERQSLRAIRASARADDDRRQSERDLREFLQEVQLVLEEQRREAQLRLLRVDVRGYPLYTHGPLAALGATWGAFAPGINLILDFVPVIGQLKGVAESIIGYDITGRKLETWERGLGALLSVLPFARGVFSAGKKGIRVLAVAGAQAVSRGRRAEEVYRAAKVASRMSEAEIRAAQLTGKAVSATQVRAVENMLGHLDEMQGLSRRGWRAASGTIDNGVSTSRSASGVIDTAAVKPGKVIGATKASKAVASKLAKTGVSADAIAQLERAGVQFSEKLVNALTKSPSAVEFVNGFHRCSGFVDLVKDLAVSAGKQDGALFAMAYAVKKVDPRLAKFELAAGITKYTRGTRVAARRVDITVSADRTLGQMTTVNYELKSWSKWTLERELARPTSLKRALATPNQFVKDTAIFGRAGIRWVFNSAKITKKEVIAVFRKAVTTDPYLKVKWPQGEALDQALDNLIEEFPQLAR